MNDIVNSFNLSETIIDNRIVRNVLRSLPKRFRPKLTAIENSNDLDTMKIEEFVGSLQIHELTLPQPKRKTLKIAREEANDYYDEEFIDKEDLHLLAKKFKKFLKPRKGDFRRLPRFGEI